MKKRLIALLLCVVMLATTMGAGILMPPDIKLISADTNEAVSSVAVPQSERVKIATDYESSNELGYQWQLSQNGKTWVNIYDQTADSILLSYAMVCNMLSDDGTAQVRCIITDGDSEYESRAAEVSIDYSAPARSAKAPARAAVQNDAPANDAPANDAELGQRVFEINYVFEDNTQAANPWTATVPESETDYEQVVSSPTVVGYRPDKTSVTVSAKDTETKYTVTYYPDYVTYKVNHYQQDITTDNYTLYETEDKTGITKSQVGGSLEKTYEGFTALLYDTTIEVAADGSTVIDIYYDRNYYLLSLSLDGGYGAEPMYARYGTDIAIDNPTKAGYTFLGWDPELPKTMPAKSSTHTAQWKADDTAKVTVVIWGENANDENYSYYSDATVFLKPGTECAIGVLSCGKEEHTHTSACGSVCTHKHDYKCYGGIKQENPVDEKTGSANENIAQFKNLTNGVLENGKIYRVRCNAGAATGNTTKYDKYYLYFNGTWYLASDAACAGTAVKESGDVNAHGHTNYVLTGNNKDHYWVYNVKLTCTHTHNDSCYSCGKAAHTHSSSCYFQLSNMDPKLWTLNTTKTEKVTVKADGSTIFNVYYDRTEFTLTFKDGSKTVATIKDKWGADIKGKFPIVDNNGTKYEGYWWKVPSGTTTYEAGNYLLSIDAMPKENITFTGTEMGTGASLYYYVEKLETDSSATTDREYDNKSFKQYKPVVKTVRTGNLTEKEEFYEIPGFTKYKSDPSFDSDGKATPKANNYFYYTRNSYELSFYNYDADVEGETESVKYEAPLSGKSFVPDYPKALEPNAYRFAGWYKTPNGYDGSEVDWSKDTMPANDLKLYAKWVPVTHTVKTYLTKDAITSGDPLNTWSNVPHRTAIENPPKAPENGQYTFVGWFYMDNGTEKAFDFSMPVTKDLDLYAKWSSNSLVQYTIKYTLQDGTKIAPDTTGSALAGTTKTFYAKGGNELNEGYRTGHFPETSSHSLTMNIEGGNEYTFVYVAKEKVNYKVRYLETGTNAALLEEKTGETADAVITEQFVAVKGYAPDAYQKKLVLSADDSENVITFWYTKDEVHAPVQIIHWKQNIAGDGYTEYQSSTNLNGEIGETYTADRLELKGFRFNEGTSKSSGELTADGLVLNMFYDRIEYPYEFRFLEQGTGEALKNPITGTARYQAQVTANAINIPGYTLVGSGTQAITIEIEDPADTASKNVKTFYYEEKTVDIKYQIVGPNGCGTLTKYTENVNAVTGNPVGSTASIANDTYKFAGWYLDEGCTIRVDTAWVNGTKITPKKTMPYGDGVMGYESATYYAKFEYNLTSMTLEKKATPYDKNDMFIFTVTDSKGNEFAKVALTAGEKVTLTGLTVGETYTVSEDTNWSWRYEAKQAKQSIEMQPDASGNVVTFENTVENDKWLGASSYAINKCLNTISNHISAFFAQLIN